MSKTRLIWITSYLGQITTRMTRLASDTIEHNLQSFPWDFDEIFEIFCLYFFFILILQFCTFLFQFSAPPLAKSWNSLWAVVNSFLSKLLVVGKKSFFFILFLLFNVLLKVSTALHKFCMKSDGNWKYKVWIFYWM